MSTLHVGPTETYHTIAAAMNSAIGGDTIALDTGYSNESALVDKQNITVRGTSSSLDIVLTLGAGIGALTLKGNAPIAVHDNSGTNTITGNANDRLFVDYSTATATVTGTVTNITDHGANSVTYTGIENLTLKTGSGNDTVTLGDGNNLIFTHKGNDTITAGNGNNRIHGGVGNDTITAGNGNNHLSGGRGDDTMTGGGGHNALTGGRGDDTLNGGSGHDILIGGTGINTLNGHAGTATASYSPSTEAVTVSLALGTAQAVNSLETDTLTNIDNLTGSRHKDTLTGNSGNNVLTGGLGADHLNGRGGSDTFVYRSVNDSTSTAYDTITGFNASHDKFEFTGPVRGINSEITSGHLSASSFDSHLAKVIGASQLGAHHAVLFTPTSGTLSGDTFLIVDANGHAGYQAGHDLVIELTSASHLSSLSSSDFIHI